jgi:hypothetical protein
VYVGDLRVGECVLTRKRVANECTLVSAIFSTVSRVKLADGGGLRVANLGPRAQYVAGKSASVDTLAVALELGMPCTDDVLCGAAISGSLSKLQWLYTEQHCHFPSDISNWAAMNGSIDALLPEAVWVPIPRRHVLLGSRQWPTADCAVPSFRGGLQADVLRGQYGRA